MLALDAKLAIHGADTLPLTRSLKNAYPQLKQTVVVTYGGKQAHLSQECLQLPLNELTPFLLAW
jgi:hypothetical protein